MGIDARIRHTVGKVARIALVFLLAFWSSFQAEIAIAYGSQPAPEYMGDISTYTPDAFHNLTVLVPNIEEDGAVEGDEFLASGNLEDEAAMKMWAEPGGTLQLGAMLEWVDGAGEIVSADAQGLVFWGVDEATGTDNVASIDEKGLLTLGDGAAAGKTIEVTCALKNPPTGTSGGEGGMVEDEISAGDESPAGTDSTLGIAKVTIGLAEKPAPEQPEDPTPEVVPPYVSGLVIVDTEGNYFDPKSISATVAEGETYTLELGALVNVFDESSGTNNQLHCTSSKGLAAASAEVLANPLGDLSWTVSGGEEGGATIENGVLTVTAPSENYYHVVCSTNQGINGGEILDELFVTVTAETPEEPPVTESDQGAANPQTELKVDIVNSTGGPVGDITFTLEDIEGMAGEPALFTVLGKDAEGGDAYFTINGHGAALSTVLDRALGSVEADVALTTADIATVEFSNGSFSTGAWGYTDFVNRDRYYFPNIYSGGEGDAPFAGAVPVAPMIATTSYVNPYSVAGPTEETYLNNTCFRLLMGSMKPAAAGEESQEPSAGETPAGETPEAADGNPAGETPEGTEGETGGEAEGGSPVTPSVGDDTKPFDTVSLNHITIKLREGAGDSTGGDDHGTETEDGLRAMVTGQFAKKGQQATLSLNMGGTGDASFTIVWKESRDGGKTWEDYVEANIGEQTIHVPTDDEHIGRQYRADVHVMFTDGTDKDIESNVIEMHEDDGSLSVGLGYEAVYNGDTAIFSATVNGASQGDVEYIWEESSDGGLTWNTVSGASGPTYATVTDEAHLGNWFRVRVKDKDGNEATSNIQQMMALVDTMPIDEEGNFVEDDFYDPELEDLGYDYNDYVYEPTVTEVSSIEKVEETKPNEKPEQKPVEDPDLVQEEQLTDDSLKLYVDPTVSQAVKEQEQKKLDSTPGAKWSQITKVDAPTVKEILSDNPFVPLSVPFCIGTVAAGVVEKTLEYRNQKRKPAASREE
ncbi:MAG: hypothetical protein ACOYIP_07980 [Coriobacteriales bacterium]|jgi:hypothetical protein